MDPNGPNGQKSRLAHQCLGAMSSCVHTPAGSVPILSICARHPYAGAMSALGNMNPVAPNGPIWTVHDPAGQSWAISMSACATAGFCLFLDLVELQLFIPFHICSAPRTFCSNLLLLASCFRDNFLFLACKQNQSRQRSATPTNTPRGTTSSKEK